MICDVYFDIVSVNILSTGGDLLFHQGQWIFYLQGGGVSIRTSESSLDIWDWSSHQPIFYGRRPSFAPAAANLLIRLVEFTLLQQQWNYWLPRFSYILYSLYSLIYNIQCFSFVRVHGPLLNMTWSGTTKWVLFIHHLHSHSVFMFCPYYFCLFL